ncbi:MAG: hypothetical protein EOO43_25395 [Flavobacterium sp.]|nr:MAG: hypothetical protein EOO43_25395 [Flavobacterium sp.]
MKNILISLFTVVSIIATSCSGKKADEANADSMYKYTDTNISTVDTTTKDSVNTKGFPDSTSNSPRMPGGN